MDYKAVNLGDTWGVQMHGVTIIAGLTEQNAKRTALNWNIEKDSAEDEA